MKGLHLPNVLNWHTTLPFLAVVGGLGVVLLIVAAVLHSIEGRRTVALYGLYGVVGLLGAGKSYMLTWFAFDARKRGRPIFDNYGVEGSTRLNSWADVLKVPDGSLVLLDEVDLWWNTLDYAAPPEIRSWFKQLRHHDITCLWATQSASFAPKMIRELSFGIFQGSKWRRGHRYICYPPRLIDSMSKDKKSITTIYLRRSKKVQRTYDTKGDVTPRREWGSSADVDASSGRGRTAALDAGGS